MKVLVVDDQRSARRILVSILTRMEGVESVEAGSLEDARDVLARQSIDLALIDIRLDADARNRDGLILVKELRERGETVPVVVTGSHEISEIRTALRHGAHDYILKDELCEELVAPIIDELRTRARLTAEVMTLRAQVQSAGFPNGLVGASASMQRLRETIRRVAASDRPVLVLGPTGAGKELVVQALHSLGERPAAPLLDLNCGAIPEALIESQLFGHARGAFTGADRQQDGYFSSVGNGTLFLDEIAELPVTLQAKLLRVLESGRYRRVGATEEQVFRGRIVAATHADLEGRVREGRFREDLLYRLHVLVVKVPSLDERRDDIPALVAHFAAQQKRSLSFTDAALAALQHAPWPGNVRQLRNVIDRLAVFSDAERIDAADIQQALSGGRGGVIAAPDLRALAREVLKLPNPDKLQAFEEALISEAMTLSDGNKSAAARLLGVHRKVVERRLEDRRQDGGAGDE